MRMLGGIIVGVVGFALHMPFIAVLLLILAASMVIDLVERRIKKS